MRNVLRQVEMYNCSFNEMVLQWRRDWCVICGGWGLQAAQLNIHTDIHIVDVCRSAAAGAFAKVAPPEHPDYDLYKVVDAALEEDAGDYGDITTVST